MLCFVILTLCFDFTRRIALALALGFLGCLFFLTIVLAPLGLMCFKWAIDVLDHMK